MKNTLELQFDLRSGIDEQLKNAEREIKEAQIKFKGIKSPQTIYKNDKPMTLKEMQDAVGGQIELAYADGETQIVCNEEGKIKGLPENEEATDLWNEKLDKWNEKLDKMNSNPNFINSDYLVGDVLVLTGKARME